MARGGRKALLSLRQRCAQRSAIFRRGVSVRAAGFMARRQRLKNVYGNSSPEGKKFLRNHRLCAIIPRSAPVTPPRDANTVIRNVSIPPHRQRALSRRYESLEKLRLNRVCLFTLVSLVCSLGIAPSAFAFQRGGARVMQRGVHVPPHRYAGPNTKVDTRVNRRGG